MNELLSKVIDGLYGNPTFIIIFFSYFGLTSLFFYYAARGRFLQASNFLIAVLSIAIFFGRGHDRVHHAARIHELTQSMRAGNLDFFLFVGNEGLPIFYYYSTALYGFAVPFNLLGLNAEYSVGLVATTFFLTMALSARQLFAEIIVSHSLTSTQSRELSGVVVIALLTSTYVYSVFAVRNAYPEAAVYSLIPLIVLWLKSRRLLLVGALLCLQITIHPPVMPQAAIAVILAHLTTTSYPLRSEILRLLVLYLGAVAVTVPAWFWALRDKALIMGLDGVPVSFEDTFLSLSSLLLQPTMMASPGPYIVALICAAIWCYGVVSSRSVILVCAATVTLLMQTMSLKPIVVHIPYADIGLFIWRWMFVTIWFLVLAFALLWRAKPGKNILKVIVVFGGLHAAFSAGREIAPAVPITHPVYSEYFKPLDDDGVRWGHSEFYPRYTEDLDQCNAVKVAEFAQIGFFELWTGSIETDTTVAISKAPLAGLTYLFDGNAAETVGCGSTLFVIHPDPGRTATLDLGRSFLVRTPILRMISPYIFLGLIIASVFLSNWHLLRKDKVI